MTRFELEGTSLNSYQPHPLGPYPFTLPSNAQLLPNGGAYTGYLLNEVVSIFLFSFNENVLYLKIY